MTKRSKNMVRASRNATAVSGSTTPSNVVPSLRSQLESVFKKIELEKQKALNYDQMGFRCSADQLHKVVTLWGLAGSLRSFSLKGKAVGLCLTATHNSVIMIDPHGGLRHEEFDPVVDDLLNPKRTSIQDHVSAFANLFQKITNTSLEEPVDKSPLTNCLVVLGRDIRIFCPRLNLFSELAIQSLGAHVLNLGIVTTPQVHYITRIINEVPERKMEIITALDKAKFSKKYITMYDDYLINAVHKLTQCMGPDFGADSPMEPWEYIVDVSNGVIKQHLSRLLPAFKDLKVTLDYRNTEDTLNDKCGVKHIYDLRLLPSQIGSAFGDKPWTPGFSVDRDADRLVFFRVPDCGTRVEIVDGDRQAAVIVRALSHLIELILNDVSQEMRPVVLSIGVVQTVISNGNSKDYISEFCSEFNSKNSKWCRMHHVNAKVGFKHLHLKAEEYDIGIYLDTNGYGTILYKPEALQSWSSGLPPTLCNQMQAYLDIFNPAIGDAQANVLAFLAALRILKMDLNSVYFMYTDLDTCMRKGRMNQALLNTLKCTPENEARLQEPAELQEAIDSILAANPGSRGFIQVAGPEEIQFGAESNTPESANRICDLICDAFRNYLVRKLSRGL